MKRRRFLQASMGAGAVSPVLAKGDADAPLGVVDTNVSLFRWPFRRLPLDESTKLVEKLRELGITSAWAGSFEGILHRDVARVNERLIAECARFPELSPVGTVNPALPSWKQDLKRCASKTGVFAIRLYPNYHEVPLGDPRFRACLEAAAAHDLLVQLCVAMEDTRTQHERVRVADVDLAPLPGVVESVPGVRVQLLNGRPRGAVLEALADQPSILFDTARVDATDGVRRLREAVSPDRVLFGSHAPFLIPEAALIRAVHESGLEAAALRQLLEENAKREREGRKG